MKCLKEHTVFSILNKSFWIAALGMCAACSDSGTSSDDNGGGAASTESEVDSCLESATACPASLDENTICDSRDGQVYKTVKIGDQIWLAQNMNFCTTQSWCYKGKEENCQKYGRLYSWTAAMGLEKSYQKKYADLKGNVQGVCPEGFHVSSVEDWNALDAFAEKEADAKGTDVGMLLRSSTNDWKTEDNEVFGEMGGPGSNDLGFNALPAGKKAYSGYEKLGTSAYYWTADEDKNEPPFGGPSNAIIRYLEKTINDVVGVGSMMKDEAHSIRCVKD